MRFLMNPVVLGYACHYCPDCDLLVAHQDEIERLLVTSLPGATLRSSAPWLAGAGSGGSDSARP